jgi:enoyl-[acyl-carrier-protein] reductase (NADH)
MRTFFSAADIANMLLYLCSEMGNKISGQVVSVDGHMENLR